MNFTEQATKFIAESQSRKRSPIKAATVAKYQFSLAHALPMFGNRDLSEINNGALKVLVTKLAGNDLSASTITGVVTVVKLVVASAVNSEGEELYPRTWNNEFMELPIISDQEAPVATPEGVSGAISRANGQDKALVALLAGTGLRVGEALVLTAEDWDRVNFTLSVTKTLVRGHIQNSTKTDAGKRTVDLTPELNGFLARHLPANGLLFRSATGGTVREMTLYDHLNKLGIPGFHSLRRFRVTQLRKSAIPEGLIKFWTGHSNESITDRYDKIRENVVARKEFAQKAGLGFQLEAI